MNTLQRMSLAGFKSIREMHDLEFKPRHGMQWRNERSHFYRIFLDARSLAEGLRPITLASALGGTFGLLLLCASEAAPGPAQIVSKVSWSSLSGNADSGDPIVSGDGEWVLFNSAASDLTGRDANDRVDAFVRGGRTFPLLVSVNWQGTGSGNEHSLGTGISANGRFVVFESAASDLVENDVNGVMDVFLRDLREWTTVMVSVTPAGEPGNRASTAGAISDDGRYVVFESLASNLVASDANGTRDVFLRDMELGVTRALTVRFGTSAPASVALARSRDLFRASQISRDGRYVVFETAADQLVAADQNGKVDLFVHVTDEGRNFLASTTPTGAPAGAVGDWQLSGDGSALAMILTWRRPEQVARLITATATPMVVGVESGAGPRLANPSISNDGRRLAFVLGTSLMVWDAERGTAEAVNPGADGAAGIWKLAHSRLSGDGTTVVFGAVATNQVLTPSGQSILEYGPIQLFATSVDSPAPVPIAGLAGDIVRTSLSFDGTVIAFQASADQVQLKDHNACADVFVAHGAPQATDVISARQSAASHAVAMAYRWLAPGCLSADGNALAYVGAPAEADLSASGSNVQVIWAGLASNARRLVSMSNGAARGAADAALNPALSANGLWVAFDSAAPDLMEGDTNGTADVFLWNADSGEVRLASAASSGSFANGGSRFPSLSANGRRVAFQSSATDLVPIADSNMRPDIFVRDFDTGETVMASVNADGTATMADEAWRPVLSPDGRFVAFLARPLEAAEIELFIRDLDSQATAAVTAGEIASLGNETEYAFSLDSRWLLFTASQPLSPGPSIFRYPTAGGETGLVKEQARSPAASASGNIIVCETTGGPGVHAQIIEIDTETGTEERISAGWNDGGEADAPARHAGISADGRYVVFASRASNLVDGDDNGVTDVFLRDRIAGTTWMLSQGMDSGISTRPFLSQDGTTVVFWSSAQPLDTVFNASAKVMAVRISTDSDGDGLPDDWEAAFFGNLDRDGTGDWDEDGAMDWAEYRAGTNPIDDDSVLRVLTVTLIQTGQRNVLWTAVAGRKYQVQFKDDLLQLAWSDLGEPVVATSASGFQPDTSSGSAARFYRVVLLNP